MLPFVISSTISCVIVGKAAEKRHYVPSCIVGNLLQVLGAGLFYSLQADSPLWRVYVYEVILGAGCGGLSAVGTTVALHKIETKHFARAVAYINFVLEVAACIGIIVQGALLNKSVSMTIGCAFVSESCGWFNSCYKSCSVTELAVHRIWSRRCPDSSQITACGRSQSAAEFPDVIGLRMLKLIRQCASTLEEIEIVDNHGLIGRLHFNCDL